MLATLPALFASLALLATASAEPARSPVRSAAAPLALEELLVVRDGRAELSPKARSLAGRRVKVRGWLVLFEERGEDGFWLARRPVFQDESGAGSGDLPPGSVWVLAPPEIVRALPAGSVPLQVAGRLELGRRDDAEGRPSQVRVLVESARDVLRISPPRRR